MKLIKRKDFRVVDYFGIQLSLPTGYNYVVTDDNGIVYTTRELPQDRGFDKGMWDVLKCGGIALAEVDLEGVCYGKTLRIYSENHGVEIKTPALRAVDYYGTTLFIPETYRFVATDDDGNISAFAHRPAFWFGKWADDNGKYPVGNMVEPPAKPGGTLLTYGAARDVEAELPLGEKK